MICSQISAEEIYNAFIYRIEKTNMLFRLLKDDSLVELSNAIFFKYYFDISTAIEAILRGIAFEEAKFNHIIEYYAKPNETDKSYFLSIDELKALVKSEHIFKRPNQEDFLNRLLSKIPALGKHNISKSLSSLEEFYEDYKNVRKTRNILAHGLIQKDVDYSNNMLESFLYVMYVLLCYYEYICDIA